MKKIILTLGIMVIMAATGCNDQEEKAVTVDYEHIQTEDSKEYAVIQGKDDQGKVVWKIETEKNPMALINEVQEIGVRGDHYYYQSSKGIFAVNISDGSQIWKNKDARGEHFLWGEDGNLYMIRSSSPEFCVLDQDGKTIHIIKEFDPDGVYKWPADIRMDRDKILIELTKDSSDSQAATCVINAKDFSYTMKD